MSLPDLRRHGVVEAHAGTGKTYTIVATVLELLARERLELRQILLVTYTQKAAGELAERIRKGIARTLLETGDESLRAHLQACLGQFSECWIGTIHGVALRILRTWPFESGLPFRTELVDDAEGLETELRTTWRRAPFALSDEEHDALRDGGSLSRLLDRALELAQARLDPDAVLLPEDGAPPEALAALREARRGLPEERARIEPRLASAETRFRELLEATMPAADRIPAAGFSKGFAKRWETSLGRWRKCLAGADLRKRGNVLGSGGGIAGSLGKSDKALPEALEAVRLWELLHDAWTSAIEPDATRLSGIESTLETIDDELRARVLSAWASDAAARWRERKRAEGLLSYQDMLERLREAVRDDGFRQQLRARVRVGIIDEFQDTSALQWEIFRRWFVDDNPAHEPRLYLVGDPKQSIYSFQSADVRTYLRACDDLERAGGTRLALRHNWRSTPELIHAVNRVLLEEPDWFPEGIVYETANAVEPPPRQDAGASDPGLGAPVRLVPIEGGSGARRAAWAGHVAATILALKGRSARLPEGDAWTERVLDWGDFAIVVQTRTSVPAFRRALRRAGIPFALYKEAGVFGSRAAREFACMLAAVAEPPSSTALRTRALLTRFFGVPVDAPDPSRHLADDAPASALLGRLRGIAMEGRWPLLFREILAGTDVQRRILEGEEGDRHWMDLRQTMQHALEFLVLGRGGIPELLEHLRRLARGDETAAEDRNLHARATDRGRVQILTMHVSKGLEFPVVFLSPSARPRRKDQNRWIAQRDGELRLHVAPKEHGKDDPSLAQAEEESRRLLYVAMTRPKLLLVAPCFRGPRRPDDILSLRLSSLVETPPRGVVVEQPLPPPRPIDRPSEPGSGTRPLRQDPSPLRLRERALVLSSYSAIARSAAAGVLDGRRQRAEEASESVIPRPDTDRPDSWLPRGATSGDALHELLELLLRQDDLSWCREAAEPPSWLLRETAAILSANGLDPALASRASKLAVDVLASDLPLPDGASARLCDLPRAHRRPEVEFHCAFDARGGLVVPGADSGARQGWLVGYVDLLFRHGDRWHVLDWKTTSLAGWEPETLDRGMLEHDYALQASLYAHVLAAARPRVRCGGAVYVFLRAFADPARAGSRAGVWTATPGALEATPVAPRLERWLHARRTRPERGGDAR